MTRPLLPVLFLAACASHASQSPPTTAAAKIEKAAAAPVEAALPKSPDVSHEIMGWVVATDGERLMRELVPPAAHDAPSDALESQLFASFGLDPVLAEMVDLRRPAAVALINPALLSSTTVRPYVAMLPITSRARVQKALESRGATLELTPWGFVLPTGAGRIFVGFQHGYALVAWRADLLEGARRLLEPRLTAHADAPLVVHIDMENVYASFGPQLERVLAGFERLSGQAPDPQLGFALRGLKQVTARLGSVSAVELLADVDSGGLTLTARADGKQSGEWTEFVQQQKPGPAWGVQFLPRDSVMVYTTRSSPRGRADDVAASVEYLAEATPAHRPQAAEIDRWRRVLLRATSETAGELAYAVWPARSGGLGLGGAYRVGDAPAARAAMRAVYGELGGQLGGLVARALLLDPTRYSPRVAVKQRAARIADTDVDLVEVSLRWPTGAESERRSFEMLFGAKLTLATTFVGDQALFALGPDWSERLGTMIGAAHGGTPASMGDEPAFVEALAYHEGSRVSMSYLSTDRMARFAAGLVAQVNELDDQQRATMTGMLRQVAPGAIVSTTNASASRFELTTHIPASALLGGARLNGALWRVALSPLVNPPMVPPMPVPPPHVTPSLTPAAEGSSL